MKYSIIPLLNLINYFFFFLMIRRPPRSTLFPYTRSSDLFVNAYGIPGYNYILERATNLAPAVWIRSEEHTSELQSQSNLVCRLLLEKKKNCITYSAAYHSSSLLFNLTYNCRHIDSIVLPC